MEPHEQYDKIVAELLTEQPAPTPGGVAVLPTALCEVEDSQFTLRNLIHRMLVARAAQGAARYGMGLHTEDGRNTVADLAQELVDAAMYASKLSRETDDAAYAEVGHGILRALNLLLLRYMAEGTVVLRLGDPGEPVTLGIVKP